MKGRKIKNQVVAALMYEEGREYPLVLVPHTSRARRRWIPSMLRPPALIALVTFILTGGHLYQAKHQTALRERELRDVNKAIETTRDRTQILRAEWAMLNEPERLRNAASRHLELSPMTPGQFVRVTDIDARLPTVQAFAGAPPLFVLPPVTVPEEAPAPVSLAAQGTSPARPATAVTQPATPPLVAAAAVAQVSQSSIAQAAVARSVAPQQQARQAPSPTPASILPQPLAAAAASAPPRRTAETTPTAPRPVQAAPQTQLASAEPPPPSQIVKPPAPAIAPPALPGSIVNTAQVRPIQPTPAPAAPDRAAKALAAPVSSLGAARPLGLPAPIPLATPQPWRTPGG